MWAFRTFDGLKTITRRGSIGTSTPVFGLRPTRSPLLRTMNEPNEDSFTVSPRSQAVADLGQDPLDQFGRFGPRETDLLVHGLAQIRSRYRFSSH